MALALRDGLGRLRPNLPPMGGAALLEYQGAMHIALEALARPGLLDEPRAKALGAVGESERALELLRRSQRVVGQWQSCEASV